jgi:serine/threonine-protein kinase ATR
MQPLYCKLADIYSKLEDPDSLDGLFTNAIVNPPLEQRIIHHEVTGKWNLAQACYDLLLREQPQQIANQIGLVRCLKNLGHNQS